VGGAIGTGLATGSFGSLAQVAAAGRHAVRVTAPAPLAT
jgi:hypothetical protein